MICLEMAGKDYFTGQGHDVCALSSLTLSIQKGEFVGIAGKNASGKTTLARLLNGLLLPTRGRVMIDGMDTRMRKHRMEIRRRVAMVFQNPENQIVNPIVEEEVAFGPENLNLSPSEVEFRVEEALKLMKLEEFRKHAPHLLSGGQKQRVAIASALAMKPDYLVLDEPTSMLDQGCRRELMEHLYALNRKQKMTIILISHSMDDLAEADRIVVLERGSLIADGSPWQIFQQDDLPEALKAPEISQLIGYLDRKGCQMVPQITTRKEMVEYLCRS